MVEELEGGHDPQNCAGIAVSQGGYGVAGDGCGCQDMCDDLSAPCLYLVDRDVAQIQELDW
uniref:hypothetical protein n=1 Tax=Streptomyces anthocyanicus TaxID=68174 RepID=UPI002F91610F